MRWLFVGIVVLNVLYFGWSLLTGDARNATATTAAVDAEAREFPATLQLLDPGKAAPSGASTVPPALAGGCPALGPVASEKDAESLIDSLSEGGVEAVSQKVNRAGVPLYWVYLPPHEGRQQALRKLRELHAAGIDSFIVAEGADANAVSLGSFGNKDSALGLQARLRAAGYGAQVREQQKTVAETWVVLRKPDAQGFMEFIPGVSQASLRLERRNCP